MARQLAAQGRARARAAQRETASSVHDQMREEARRSPGWQGLEDGVVMIENADGSYVFGFDPSHPEADRATQLEFGTSENRPESVFRKVLHGQRPQIERDFGKRLR